MTESATAADAYIANLLAPRYDMKLFQEIADAAVAGGLPQISISASQGMLLHTLVKAIGARRILEIGTLGGYSGCWMATALPAYGRLVTLEIDQKHAEVARSNFARAGVADKVEVITGPASETLATLIAHATPPFDIIFIDADKPGYLDYLDSALKLACKGELILADNTLSHGVLDGDGNSPIGRFNTALAATENLTSAIIPVMKGGLDGFSISVVG